MNDQTFQDSAASLSTRSTKQEIWGAYQELLKEFQKKSEDRRTKAETKQASEKEVIQKAAGYSVENILEAIANLDSTVRRDLQALAEQLIRESQKLKELQEAICVEEEHLEKTKKIKVEVDTLESLIEAQKFQIRQFEEEKTIQEEEFRKAIQAKRDAWKREQEDYDYERDLQRRKEENAYQEKQLAREADFARREKELALQEQELRELRVKAKQFPIELEAALKKAREETEREVSKNEQIKADLLQERYEGERKIASLTIETLKERVAALENEVTALKTQLASATREVKDVAVKVIEGHSRFEEAERLEALRAKERGRGEGNGRS